LVEDHAITRSGLTALLESEEDFYVCGMADNAADALLRIAKLEPAIIISDIGLRNSNGLELMEKLMVLCPQVPVLAVSGHQESSYAERALRAGARGYLSKQQVAEKIVPAIRTILKGGIYRDDPVQENLPEEAARSPRPTQR
jgi:DNA-binding NarL/FixJ family response regulator